MARGFNYSELAKWVNNLGVATKEFDSWLKKFMLQQGQLVRNKAIEKQRTYTYVNAKGETKLGLIDTGNMIRSWYVGDVQVEGDSIYVTVGNPAEYASYIEYGQRSFAGAYLLTTSIDEVQKNLPTQFNNDFTNWLARKGVLK